MRTRSDSATLPSPRQVGHTVLPERPVPPQVGHVFSRRSDREAIPPEHRVAKRHLDLAAQVLARLRARSTGAPPPKRLPNRSPMSPDSNWKSLEGRRPSRAARTAAAESPRGRPGVESGARTGMAEAVVGAPLFVVLEDVVGLLDLLEALLGGFIARD